MDATVWTISARPVYDQDTQSCLDRPEVQDAELLTSYPSILEVRLRPGTPRAVADEIANCLRSLPGELMDVKGAHIDGDGALGS